MGVELRLALLAVGVLMFIGGVALLHKVEDTRFKKGYNRYKFKGHWESAPTIIPAEEGE